MSTNNTGSRCVVLSGPAPARYIPQYDEQVHKPAKSLPIPNYDVDMEHPFTPQKLKTHYCKACELTWLVGFAGLETAKSHPSHHAARQEYTGQTKRSMVIYIDSACTTTLPRQAALGVYFGSDSKHNISRKIPDPHPSTQVADIWAAIEALRHVRAKIWPQREALVRADELSHVILIWPDGWSTPATETMRGISSFRLILGTNSTYLVEFACRRRHTWKLDAANQTFRNSYGRWLKNGTLYADLEQEIDALSRIGVQVQWYLLPRDFNYCADRLAWSALPVLDEHPREEDEVARRTVLDAPSLESRNRKINLESDEDSGHDSTEGANEA